jgi:hypothetical protein
MGLAYSQGRQLACELDEDGCGRWVMAVDEDPFNSAVLRRHTC